MLNLVFYVNDYRLKVRHASSDDDFSHACHWKNKLRFIVSDSGDFMMTWTSLLPDLEAEYAEALVDLVGARYPVSSNYHALKKECPKIIYSNKNDEWVIFGGTFNPWHAGHQACLNLIPDDKICLITPDRNPHKELRDLNTVSTILEISVKAKLKQQQYLVPTFLLETKKNPTVVWVEKMQENFPNQKISLLMGFDSFAKLKTWTRSEDLLPKLNTIYVVSRLEDDKARQFSLGEVLALNPNITVHFLGKHDFENLSSTDIRNKNR